MAKNFKIRWTADERERLYNAAVYLLQTGGGWDAFTQPELFARMQHVVPAERKREPVAGNASAFFKDLRKHVAARKIHIGAMVSPAAQLAAEAPQPPAPPSGADAVTQALIDAGVDVVEGVLTHPAVLAAVRALARAVLGRDEPAPALEGENVPGVPELAPWPGKAAAARGPKVLVAGYNRDKDLPELVKHYGDKLRLRFWMADESKRHLKSLVADSDVVLGMVSWCGHSAYQIMKSRARRFIHVSGHMTELRAAIDRDVVRHLA